MKINEVTQVNEIGLAAIGSIAKSLGGAALKGIGKSVAAGLDSDLGKALGAGQTTQVSMSSDQMKAAMGATAKKLAPNLAKQWASMSQQMIADQQASMPAGAIAQWKDVPPAIKLKKLDDILNSTLSSIQPGLRDYKQLATYVEDDPYSQQLAVQAIRVIDLLRDKLSKPTPPANLQQEWEKVVAAIASAARVAGRRQATTQKQSRVAFDKTTGKWTYDGSPLDASVPEQRAAQAEYMRLNPGWASP